MRKRENDKSIKDILFDLRKKKHSANETLRPEWE